MSFIKSAYRGHKEGMKRARKRIDERTPESVKSAYRGHEEGFKRARKRIKSVHRGHKAGSKRAKKRFGSFSKFSDSVMGGFKSAGNGTRGVRAIDMRGAIHGQRVVQNGEAKKRRKRR